MIINNSLFKKFFIILFIFIQYEIYCQELSKQEIEFDIITNVFCSKNNYSWKWLEEDNNRVSISGDLIKYIFKINDFEEFNFKYFKLNGGRYKFDELKKKCISKFGDEYIFAQPGSGLFDSWYVFGDEDGVVFDGIFEVKLDLKYFSKPFSENFINYRRLNIKKEYINLSNYIKIRNYIPGVYCIKDNKVCFY